jgi:hypothetical protein
VLTLSIPEPANMARVVVLSRDASFQSRAPCTLPAAGAKVTLNGRPLERLRGKPTSGDLMYDRDCILEFAIDPGAIRKSGPAASLQISDESATWSVEVPSAFAARSFKLSTPNDPVIHRGQRVVLKWTPADDPIDPRDVGIELYRAGDRPGSGTAFRNIEVRGDELSFVIPPSSAAGDWTGPAVLRLLGGYLHPAVRHCPVRECDVIVQVDVPPLAVSVED